MRTGVQMNISCGIHHKPALLDDFACYRKIAVCVTAQSSAGSGQAKRFFDAYVDGGQLSLPGLQWDGAETLVQRILRRGRVLLEKCLDLSGRLHLPFWVRGKVDEDPAG